jgi:hypothetical protein
LRERTDGKIHFQSIDLQSDIENNSPLVYMKGKRDSASTEAHPLSASLIVYWNPGAEIQFCEFHARQRSSTSSTLVPVADWILSALSAKLMQMKNDKVRTCAANGHRTQQ